MKNLTIQNYQTAQAQKINRDGNEFIVRPVVSGDDIKQCQINFVEIAPGNYAYGFHWHEMNEEAFYIISGNGTVRTDKGEKEVKTGDVITFPAGKDGAHVIRNTSATEKLIYIDFDTASPCDIVHLPDTNQIMCAGPFSFGIYDEKKA